MDLACVTACGSVYEAACVVSELQYSQALHLVPTLDVHSTNVSLQCQHDSRQVYCQVFKEQCEGLQAICTP